MGDYRITTGEPLPTTARNRQQQRLRILIGSASGLLVVLAAGLAWRVDRYVPASGDVTTERYAEVRPAVVGKVSRILGQSGQTVQAGDLVVELEDAEERAALEEARSQANKIEAELVRREAEMAETKRAKEAAIAVSELRLKHASSKVALTRELAVRGLASAQSLEDEQLAEQLAKAEMDARRGEDPTLPEKELAVLRQELGARREAVTRMEAQVRSRRIVAPIAGRLLRYEFVAGELVRPDTVLYEVFGGDRQILKLRIPERYATLVSPGQTYRAQLMPYRKLRRVWFRGKVESLRDVIQAENGKTYRVVFCGFDAARRSVPPGTTAEAEVCVARSSFWAKLFGLY